MSVFALLLLAQAPSIPERTPPSRNDVVVTGRRLKDTAAALKACLDRHCPPDQDIAATLAHAENEFVGGDYRGARETIAASRGRNKRFAKAYPVPVSDLLRAGGRVAAHLGEGDDFRIYTIDSLDALKAGLPAGDPRVLSQRIEVGDMFARLGRPQAALSTYAEVVGEARRADQPVLEGLARLRGIVLELQLTDRAGPGSGDRHEAMTRLASLANDPDARLGNVSFAARILQAQVAAKRGDTAALDAVIAEMRNRGAGETRPVLIYARPIRLVGRPEAVTQDDGPAARDVLTRTPIGDFDRQWIDVAYWIKPDGGVDHVAILRQSTDKSGDWERPVLEAVGTRRYAPLALSAGDPGLFRVERYTYTSNFDNTVSGTRLRTREGQPRIEGLDLTEDALPGRGGASGDTSGLKLTS